MNVTITRDAKGEGGGNGLTKVNGRIWGRGFYLGVCIVNLPSPFIFWSYGS